MRITRTSTDIRKPKIDLDFCPNADASLLYGTENTKIICAASISTKVPEHAEAKGTGWVTAEYNLLPYSTSPRGSRPLMKQDGRSVEIQRLISRSLRGAVDLTMIQGFNIHIDCDVLQADGGTRTAAITGGFIALKKAIEKMIEGGQLNTNPILFNVAAISVGIVNDELMIDLDYSEDRNADVDMNVVMDSDMKLIEIQGTGEKTSFSIDQLDKMILLAQEGIKNLFEVQNSL